MSTLLLILIIRAMNPRYDGKPLLRLIELYVLHAIGELQTDDAENLKAMTPNLQQIYGTEGDWSIAIAKAMGFPDDMPEAIRSLWEKNRIIAAERGATLTAEDFAVMFVDANFPQD